MADNYLDIFSQEGVYFISSTEKVLVTRADSVNVGHILLRRYQLPRFFLWRRSRCTKKED